MGVNPWAHGRFLTKSELQQRLFENEENLSSTVCSYGDLGT